MIYDIDIAKQVAKSLLQINAIILQPNDPFKWKFQDGALLYIVTIEKHYLSQK